MPLLTCYMLILIPLKHKKNGDCVIFILMRTIRLFSPILKLPVHLTWQLRFSGVANIYFCVYCSLWWNIAASAGHKCICFFFLFLDSTCTSWWVCSFFIQWYVICYMLLLNQHMYFGRLQHDVSQETFRKFQNIVVPVNIHSHGRLFNFTESHARSISLNA